MSVPGYESYRQSGVEWNPEVPSHWTDTRLRFVAKLNPSKSEIASRDRQEDVSFVPMDAVGDDGSVRLEQTRPIGEVETGYTYFANGDVTVAKITPCFENGKGAVMRGLQGGIGFGTTELIVARPSTDTSADFLHWLFTSSAFRKLGEGAMYGAGGQKRVSDDFVRDFPVAMPPHSEQTAIAAFLDRETGKIDALVGAQRRLIELLKEKRQAVISHAVTKGLDPAVPMKNSGVEWLGEVPTHWEVRPFRYALSCIESGTSVNAVDVPARGDELGVLKTSCVYSGAFAPNENKTVVAEEVGRVSCPVRGGTLIVSRMNTPDLVGAAGFVKRDVDNLFLPDRLWQLHFSGVAPAFAHYWTLTKAYRGQVQVACAGTSSSMQNLSQDQLRSFIFPFPPYSEQLEIVDSLDRATRAMDRLMIEAEDAIALLQERRAALISAAVTGKIDVRGLIAERMEAA